MRSTFSAKIQESENCVFLIDLQLFGGRGSKSGGGGGGGGGATKSINDAVKTGSLLEVKKALYNTLNVGDKIYVTESDGKEYPYTVIRKNNSNPKFADYAYTMEFQSRLPGTISGTGFTETIRTTQISNMIFNKKKKWRL